jgi:hypothetical protein
VTFTDARIGAFLGSRRKFIAGLLGIVAILVTGGLVPDSVGLAVQAITGLLALYGIHEVSNDATIDPGAA